MTFDALVIGGGPAGATAALMLAKAGWSVAIVEKGEFPRRKVCGEFISATSFPILEELGVLRAFLQGAGPQVGRIGLFAGGMCLAAPMPTRLSATAGWGRALGREHLDLLLLDAAVKAGARLWQPWKATALRRQGGLYDCQIDGKDGSRHLLARVVVAANGSWERSAAPLGCAETHRPADLLAFKAHFRDVDLPTDLMPLVVFPGGYGGLVHADDGRVTLSCCIRRDELRRLRQGQRSAAAGAVVLQRIFETATGLPSAFRRSRLDGAWLSAGPIRPGIRARYGDGIFFVGNRAGEAHPIIAEGISMAMQAGWLLAGQLQEAADDAVAGRDLAQAGRRYAAAWRDCFAARIRAAAVFARVATHPGVSRLVLPWVSRFPELLNVGARLGGKAQEMP